MNTATATPAPELPVIIANSVMAAQGWAPDADDLAAITATADWLRHLTGASRKFPVSVRVEDTSGVVIGSLRFDA